MEITYNDVKLSAEKIVAKFGRDHRYHDPVSGEVAGTEDVTWKCCYEHEGAPQCIVGHIGHVLNFEHVFWKIEGNGPDELDSFIEISYDAMLFLEYIQRYQDDGVTWGESFDQALLDMNKEP